MRAYLDNSATTKVCDAAAQAVIDAMTKEYANPSSLHSFGQSAQRIVKDARAVIAEMAGVAPDGVIFTAGGTEADNLVFAHLMRTPAKLSEKRILISGMEHPAVSSPAEYLAGLGADLVRLPCFSRDTDTPGMTDASSLPSIIENGGADIVSIVHVNSEIGTIQPVGEICRIVRESESAIARQGKRILVHSDAVQSFAKLPFPIEADAISISAHKIHGPKGIGALCSRHPERLMPTIRGGGQEGGLRSGTENVPGIAGFAAAASEATASMKAAAEKVQLLRTRLLNGIMEAIPDALLNSPQEASAEGEPGKCSPYILSMAFPGTRGEVIVHSLERDGVFVSTGTACSSIGKRGAREPSVLKLIGLSDREAEGTIRFSLSRFTTAEEIDYAIPLLAAAVNGFMMR